MFAFAKKQKPAQEAKSANSTKANQAVSRQSHDVGPVLYLQRTIEHQAVQRLLHSKTEDLKVGPVSDASAALAHDFSPIPVQASADGSKQSELRINAPMDQYEQEADRVADEVTRMAEPLSSSDESAHAPDICIQRACSNVEEECQAQEVPGGMPVVTPQVQPRIDSLRGGGEPLSTQVRAFFEPRFGVGFSAIRIHTNREAADTAADLNARAFTLGQHIVFGSGLYQPETGSGQRLLAHELAHAVQQGSGDSSGSRLSTVRPMVQRDIDFEAEAATARYNIVDPRTGEESRSGMLAQEFIDGLEKWLALDAVTSEDGIADVERNEEREDEIKSQFKKAFGTEGIEMLQDERDTEWLWGQARKTITFENAWETWEEIRGEVEEVIAAVIEDDVTVKATEAGAYMGTDGSDIEVNLKLLEGVRVAADVHASFDGFWMLVHELLHIELSLNDPVVGKLEGGRDVTEHVSNPNPQRVTRLSQSRIAEASSSLIGEVESKLNVLRVGFGLPVRTSYSNDQGTILFSKEGAIGAAEAWRWKESGDMRRMEFEGVVQGQPAERLIRSGVILCGPGTPEPPGWDCDIEKKQLVPDRSGPDPRVASAETDTILGTSSGPYVELWLAALNGKDIEMYVTGEEKEDVWQGLIRFSCTKDGFKAGYIYKKHDTHHTGAVEGELWTQTPQSSADLPSISISFRWREGGAEGRGMWSVSGKQIKQGLGKKVLADGEWWYGDEESGCDGFWFIDFPIPEKLI
jgi:hypothetical protein